MKDTIDSCIITFYSLNLNSMDGGTETHGKKEEREREENKTKNIRNAADDTFSIFCILYSSCTYFRFLTTVGTICESVLQQLPPIFVSMATMLSHPINSFYFSFFLLVF